MKKHSGSCQADVRLRLSSTDPMFAAPSPKYVTVISDVPE